MTIHVTSLSFVPEIVVGVPHGPGRRACRSDYR